MVADCLAQIDEKDDYDKQECAIKATAATVFIGTSISPRTLSDGILMQLSHKSRF
jgi:hypothetical protein